MAGIYTFGPTRFRIEFCRTSGRCSADSVARSRETYPVPRFRFFCEKKFKITFFSQNVRYVFFCYFRCRQINYKDKLVLECHGSNIAAGRKKDVKINSGSLRILCGLQVLSDWSNMCTGFPRNSR